MITETTLFNMRTLQPHRQPAAFRQVPVCGHCRHLVSIRNDSGRLFRYCGIKECSKSIIGCQPVKFNRTACRRYSEGCGEMLHADKVFKQQDIA